jgi:hypothetical protein
MDARCSLIRSMTSSIDSTTMYLVPSMSVRIVSGALSMRWTRSGFTPICPPLRRVTTITALPSLVTWFLLRCVPAGPVRGPCDPLIGRFAVAMRETGAARHGARGDLRD